jgi:hypothetical protein
MVARNLSNTKKMVGFLISIFYLLQSYTCEGQVNTNKHEMELVAFFSCDTVLMGDSVDLVLTYQNNTDSSLVFYPYGIIGMSHDHKVFITYEFPERIVYRLSNYCNYDSIVLIKPKAQISYTFKVSVNDCFFYKGENNLLVFYSFFGKPAKKSMWIKKERKARLSFWSNNTKVFVR